MARVDLLMAAASEVDVIDLAGAIIANPDRAMVSLVGQLALALAFEKSWEICIEADLLVRALAVPVTGDAGALTVQRQADRIAELMTALRGETPTEEKNDGSNAR